MKRYRANYPRDEATSSEGDASFLGVNCKLSPEELAPGMVREAVNKLFRRRVAETRPGCVCPVSHNPRLRTMTLVAADWVVVTFTWGAANGTGFSVGVLATSEPGNNLGGLVETGGPGAALPFLQLNDTSVQLGTQGRLSVLLDLGSMRADGTLGPGFVVSAGASWTTQLDGRVTTTLSAWTGGTFALVAGEWVNSGGVAGAVVTIVSQMNSFSGALWNLRSVAGEPRAFLTLDTASAPAGPGTIWGSGTYTDLARLEWLLLATEEAIWRCRDGCAPQRFAVPMALGAPCEFVSSAGKVLLFRGETLTPWVWDGTATGAWAELSQLDPGNSTRPVSSGATAEAAEDRLAIPSGLESVLFTDILSPGYYDPAITERVKPGTGGALVRLFPYVNSALLAFKEQSVHLITNVTGNLSNLAITDISVKLGLAARKAVAMVGADVFFLAHAGVFKVSQVIQDRIQTEPVPVSDSIEPLFRTRINWAAASGAVAAVLGEYYYLAVPFDGSLVNNVVLVYNTSTAQWEGWHAFSQVNVTNFERTLWNGAERLFAIDRANGQVALLYEGTADQNLTGALTSIADSLLTRGYLVGDADFKVFERAEVTTERWRTSNAAWLAITEKGSQTLYLPQRDRTKYFQYAQPAYVLTNANDDHEAAGRQGYDVRANDNLQLGSGVNFDRVSQSTDRSPINTTARWVSLKIGTGSGRCDVVQCSVEARQVARSSRTRI